MDLKMQEFVNLYSWLAAYQYFINIEKTIIII